MKSQSVTIREINEWIDNDEGLYNWFKRSRQTRQQFIKENKTELQRCISLVLNGDKPAHYLAY